MPDAVRHRHAKLWTPYDTPPTLGWLGKASCGNRGQTLLVARRTGNNADTAFPAHSGMLTIRPGGCLSNCILRVLRAPPGGPGVGMITAIPRLGAVGAYASAMRAINALKIPAREKRSRTRAVVRVLSAVSRVAPRWPRSAVRQGRTLDREQRHPTAATRAPQHGSPRHGQQHRRPIPVRRGATPRPPERGMRSDAQ